MRLSSRLWNKGESPRRCTNDAALIWRAFSPHWRFRSRSNPLRRRAVAEPEQEQVRERVVGRAVAAVQAGDVAAHRMPSGNGPPTGVRSINGWAAFQPRIARTIGMRTWKKVIRRPVVLVFSLVQPLMWMIFFGFLFNRYNLATTGYQSRYLDFLLPGVCVMTVLFGASQTGTALIRDLQTGFMRRMLLTAASPMSLLSGKIAADVVRLLLQACVVAVVGCLIGARLNPALWPTVLAVLLLTLFAVGYSSLSCWIALKTRSQETMGVFIQAVNMPLLFTSTVLVPDRHMSGWLATVSALNPLSAVANGLRYALQGLGNVVTVGQLLLGAGSAALMFAICVRRLAKTPRS